MSTLLSIDPSKKNTGWALFRDGEYLGSGSCPGTNLHNVPRIPIDTVVCERPGAANRCFGFKNRDEIILVAGRILGLTDPKLWRWIEIHQWRTQVFGASNLYKGPAWKTAALERAQAMYPDVSTHDEAEAVLIGYAALALGLDRETKSPKSKASPGPRARKPRTKRPRSPRARSGP
jgi:hypothetical protein